MEFDMEINRREFALAGAALAACACCSMDLEEAQAATPTKPVDVGTAGDYPADGAFDKFAKSDRIMLIRKGDHLYATTATCTHRNCVIKCVQEELRCPCHGSRYDLAGVVTRGPAKTPLPRYAISLNSDRRIIVDPSQRFEQNQWDDPHCFVTVG
jgi:Rieske Fe-S protein